MTLDFLSAYSQQMATLQLLLLFLNAFLHLLFAGAVASDAGKLARLGMRPAMVSGLTWAFATLLGGVIVAAIYWFIHHSTFTRTDAITRE